MKKLYEEKEVLFAVGWILVYCLLIAPIRGQYGDGSYVLTAAMFIFALAITLFVKKFALEDKYGLKRWPAHPERYLYFIPMWVLSLGNIWDGITLNYTGMPLVYAVLSMTLVGYVEEMLFRGFLFKAMLKEGSAVSAIIVSSLTFGIGHIVNLFSGQASLETLVQIIFAISWGFLFTMVYYRCQSLLPCIAAHAIIDVASLFGAETKTGDTIYVCATIVVAIAYCLYLARAKKEER